MVLVRSAATLVLLDKAYDLGQSRDKVASMEAASIRD
ncbi:hypothetical protein GGE43_002537 [Agrobacterium tumefaciens]|uniref:Uncharacterized protein n=1 Tax=Agrobacterium radiobacter TaxID=362 RepID=A0ABR6J9Z6_AGRRD|nr:hypothetical protein [Agrobacterium radiobacter]MBB4318782.1 hypothetical protein [Agrobacterium radiobacter]MBB4324050.1 hypothetical protein [Agrobacterium radiobacter]MBB4336312.1 hypothetical protein [Agrobacterium radiobacter]MBB4457837.1 hypothetical protein [Agrobacterium radiobacter]